MKPKNNPLQAQLERNLRVQLEELRLADSAFREGACRRDIALARCIETKLYLSGIEQPCPGVVELMVETIDEPLNPFLFNLIDANLYAELEKTVHGESESSEEGVH